MRPQPVSTINVAQPPVSQRSATVMAMGHLLGYGRVSATDQQPHLQVDALERAAATGFYRDQRRGRTHRPTPSTSSTSSDRRISALVERLRRLERCPLVPRSQPPDDPDRLLDALIDLVGQPPGDRPERHRPKGVARDETRGVLAPP
jgi:hypothetical protein